MGKLIVSFTGSTLLYNIYYSSPEGQTSLLQSLPIDNIPAALAYYCVDKGIDEVVLAGAKDYILKIGEKINDEAVNKYAKNDLTITYMEA